jgi:hypothetical protein
MVTAFGGKYSKGRSAAVGKRSGWQVQRAMMVAQPGSSAHPNGYSASIKDKQNEMLSLPPVPHSTLAAC